ncbi:MAG: 3'-5' exonuclease KapD [Bacillaceae bacterium]|nr:3'-5' exonuclease KapD [Bacillaceae bacterium]
MTKQYLFLDFEFTMPDDDKNRRGFFQEIIEVGLVRVVHNTVHETFSSFVKPEVNPFLNERCKNFLDITQDDVDSGITFHELVQQLQACTLHGTDTTVVTWGNMDTYVLRRQCDHWRVPYPFTGAELDLSLEHKRFYGEQNQSGLMKALLEFGQSANGKHHKALDDAMTTFEIFKLMEKDKQYLKKAESPSIGELVDLSSLFTKLLRWYRANNSVENFPPRIRGTRSVIVPTRVVNWCGYEPLR